MTIVMPENVMVIMTIVMPENVIDTEVYVKTSKEHIGLQMDP